MRLILLVLALLVAVHAQPVLEHIYVNPVNNMYIDSNGQTRNFHGLALDNNGGLPSMTPAQMQTMVDWGFNVVRMGFHWHLMELSPNVWNETYFQGIIDIVNQFESYGIYVILDMHQDCWSPLYCGAHGIPSFYAEPYNTSEYQKGGSRAYPEPVVKPTYNDNGDITDCANISASLFGWASCYMTYSLGAGAQRLYDNDNNTLQAFGNFWNKVANQFANQSNILGYEILNEPWLGDIFDNPDLLIPGQADKINLSKMNQFIHNSIRLVDNNHIIFYEPATGGNILDATPVGYTELPGGEEYQNRSGLSYHIYCPLLESDMPYHPGGHNVIDWLIEAAELAACDLLNTYQYDVRHDDVVKLHTAGFMTEFGAILNNNTFSMDYVHYAVHKMDEFFQGWTFWYLTPDPTQNIELNKALARTYARKISGIPSKMFFDHNTANFTLSFAPSNNSAVYSLPTEVYVNLPFYYPNGTAWTVTPANAVTGEFVAAQSVLLFTNNPDTAYSNVTITVYPL